MAGLMFTKADLIGALAEVPALLAVAAFVALPLYLLAEGFCWQ